METWLILIVFWRSLFCNEPEPQVKECHYMQHTYIKWFTADIFISTSTNFVPCIQSYIASWDSLQNRFVNIFHTCAIVTNVNLLFWLQNQQEVIACNKCNSKFQNSTGLSNHRRFSEVHADIWVFFHLLSFSVLKAGIITNQQLKSLLSL